MPIFGMHGVTVCCSVICRAQDSLQDQQKDFIYQSFTTPPFDEVKVEETPHGLALVLDQKDIAGVCTYAGVGVEVGVNV